MPNIIPRPFNISSQGAPAVGADIIDALVWGQNAYGGTTQVITIAQGVNGAGLLWNPAGSGVSILMYGLQISANATSGTSFTPVTTTFGTTTAGLSGFSTSGTGVYTIAPAYNSGKCLLAHAAGASVAVLNTTNPARELFNGDALTFKWVQSATTGLALPAGRAFVDLAFSGYRN